MQLKVGILCSGSLGLSTLKQIFSKIELQFIFTDINSEAIIEFAKSYKIPIFIGNPRKNCPYSFLENYKTDVIFSINYIFIVDSKIFNHPRLYAINLHGSLLPKYRGRTPHVWAIINGETETGVTAHIMEEGCDTGDIVTQKKIIIERHDTGATVLKKYQTVYPTIIFEIISKIQNGNIVSLKQNNILATYFGKRTPDDGQINWNWQKERIYNWVRAQSYPYPGAFTFINNHKLIIDWIEYTDYGFNNEMKNGLIIQVDPYFLVKTPNGVLKITKIRSMQSIEIVNNMILESPCI